MAGGCCPPALQPGCQTQYFLRATAVPGRGSVGTRLIFLLHAPRADPGLVPRSCGIFVYLFRGEGFCCSALHRTPLNSWELRVSVPACLVTGMSWKEGFSGRELLLCLCLREGGRRSESRAAGALLAGPACGVFRCTQAWLNEV